MSSRITTAGSISAPSQRMASLMGAPCWAYPKGTITSVSWTKRRSGLWVLNSVCMPQPATCRFPQKKNLVLDRGLANLLGFSREFFEPGQSHIVDKPHRLFTHQEICVHLTEVSTSENLHNGRPSTPLKSISVENEKVQGWPDRDIPRLAVQTVGIGASFPADAHDIRHGRQKDRFRLFECSPTHKKWVMRVAQGAPGNALGWL